MMEEKNLKQDIIEKILKSYTELGVVNRFDREHFPNRQHVKDVLDRIKELLFPGYFGTQVLSDHGLVYVTGHRVVALMELLENEVEKTLVWQKSGVKEESKLNESKAKEFVLSFLQEIPSIREKLTQDAEAILKGDPAAKTLTEVILSYPGFQAIMVYRIANFFYYQDIPLIPRIMTEIVHSETGIDIHPGARIGARFCIDHGTGIVIGETSEIGDDVKLYQGVTLGAFSVEKSEGTGKRHPTLQDNVTVYARSTILGGETIIGSHSVIGGNVWITESLPVNSTMYMSPGSVQKVKSRA